MTAEQTGSRIRALRKARKMTLEALSGLTGLGISQLSKIEKGTRGIRFGQAIAIAEALGVGLDDLRPAGDEAA